MVRTGTACQDEICVWGACQPIPTGMALAVTGRHPAAGRPARGPRQSTPRGRRDQPPFLQKASESKLKVSPPTGHQVHRAFRGGPLSFRGWNRTWFRADGRDRRCRVSQIRSLWPCGHKFPTLHHSDRRSCDDTKWGRGMQGLENSFWFWIRCFSLISSYKWKI